MKRVLGFSFLLLVSLSTFAVPSTFSETQKKEIQKIVHDYLLEEPEVLVEASQSLQQKQQERMQSEVQNLIKAHTNEIFQDKYAMLGNPHGDVTLVEFFDYQCGHCKKMAPIVSAVMKNSPNLRVIYKIFPIFGELSVTISQAALAAAMQDKFIPMHDALLQADGRLTEKNVMDIAKKLNLNMAQFKKDMDSQAVKQVLDENRKLAEALHLMGTPAFIIASTPKGVYKENSTKPVIFIPGAVGEAAMMDMVKKTAE